MELVRKRDKLAIVGFCAPHRDWVPYEDQDWAVWGLNRGYIFMEEGPRRPCADLWFDMHSREVFEWEQRRPGNHVTWLARFPGPVIMHQHWPFIPNSMAYPFEEVALDIGRNIMRFSPDQPHDPRLGVTRPQNDIPYLASSIAQEIALGIYMGYQEIALFGIDLNTTSEYAWQKPGVEHMLGIAAGRGIKIHLPDMCPLLRGNIYGRGYLRPEGEHLSYEQFQERLNALVDEREAYARELHLAEGAKKECEWTIAQMMPGMDMELADRRRKDHERIISNWQIKLIQCEGALNESLYWAHQTPDGQPPDEAIKQLQLARMAESGQAAGPEEGTVEAMMMDVPSSGPAHGTEMREMLAESGNGLVPAEAIPA